ncbi:disks large-associated protein 5-like [Daphnia carinata]|uniref:disks large-associated protein 5-like n=1 Tax=Daphnia carinata TaxID=120202 RepID=UPI002868404E|nr:disks large-associated protein 5-like [Daphnia carinata]
MAETRKARIDHFFRCTPKRGEERKAVGLARWKERQEKNFASCFSLANKLKLYFHSKSVSHSKAAPKEIQKPCVQTQESNSLPKRSLKKPPFIVPGRIRHNDSHLLQAVPQVKNPPKKIISTKQPIKPSTWSTSKQVSSKINSAAAVTKTPSEKDACPQCKRFVPPAGIKIPEQSSVILAQETDQQNANSANPFKQNFPSVSKPNPWITVDRRTSVQKPFNSLLSSQESSAPQAAFFREDVTYLESEEEDVDPESKPCDYQSIRHSNKDQVAVKYPIKKNAVNCNITVEEQQEQFTVTAEVHPVMNDHDNKNDPTNKIGSVTLPEVCKAPEKVEIALQLRAQMDQKKAHLDGLCNLWSGALKEEDDIPQDDVGSILTVIGQTQQLQRERFHQYSTLILQFEKNTAEKTITRTDLEGFWEMISLQVTDVENKFTQLDYRRKAGWKCQENIESLGRKKRNPKSRTQKKKDASEHEMKSSGIRSHIALLRKKQVESITSIVDNPVAFLDHQPSPVVVLSRLNVEANDFSHLKQSKGEGDTMQQPYSCQQVLLSTKVEGCTPNNDESETVCHKYLLRERKKHKSATHVGFFSSPHQPNISRLRSHTADCKVDESGFPNSSVLLPENSTTNNDKIETPKAVKVLRMNRKKHKSEIDGGFFSSPHETDSPRQRSRSTESVLDQPCSSVERWKMPISSRFRDSPKLFSPTVKQIKTRSGRVSQSPARFGQNETMSPYSLKSSYSQYTKLQKENTEKSSENADHLSSSKEENNNDVSRFPTMPSEHAST